MTSKPTISADTPPTTVWSNDVAGGGVVRDELPNVAGMKKGEVANTPASSSSKKKKKKKKQQQSQKEKVEEDLPVAGEDDEEDAETPGVTEVTEVSFRSDCPNLARHYSRVMDICLNIV